MRSIVVLLQPEGPSRVTNSPSWTVRSTASTATVSPKRLVSCWVARMLWSAATPLPHDAKSAIEGWGLPAGGSQLSPSSAPHDAVPGVVPLLAVLVDEARIHRVH